MVRLKEHWLLLGAPEMDFHGHMYSRKLDMQMDGKKNNITCSEQAELTDKLSAM